MAAEYIAQEQNVSLNSPIDFSASIPCTKGIIVHEDGTGIFILRGCTNQCNASYQVTFNGNISVPEGGAVTAIAVALTVNGEPRNASKAIFMPQAVEEFGNVTSTAIIKVPRGCCFAIAVEYVDATTNDPATTPTPTIDVANGNLTISRIA